MKIIEAMKRVKANEIKVDDLQKKIAQYCANLSTETPLYGESSKAKITEWAQSCEDISQENIRLLCAIQKTNLQTSVTIEIGGKTVTKNIAEWVWRRRKYALLDLKTYGQMTDRNLKEGIAMSTTGDKVEVKIVRNFDVLVRDQKMEMYRTEPHTIDAALEVVNATTELIE